MDYTTKMDLSKKYRNWAFTLNNYTQDAVTYLAVQLDCKYIIFGYEEAPETGTPHLQGYVIFESQHYFEGVRDMMIRGTHIEPAYCPSETNILYCKKMGHFFERGNPGQGQGYRTDLIIIRDKILSGKFTTFQLMIDHFPQYAKYGKFFEKFSLLAQNALSAKRGFEPKDVICLYGESGLGKTKVAYENFRPYYRKSPDTWWWDGYDNESTILIDDFRGKLSVEFLLNLFDGYPQLTGQNKGGTINLDGIKRIIVTSNVPPDEWYSISAGSQKEDVKGLIRRITFMCDMSKNGAAEKVRDWGLTHNLDGTVG
uniref:ATP-dependent helicase Rep n=1 Tax=Cruciviridae sp. TaxID=1955495 RepID=A0A1S6LVD5_9VIRU|nr:replication protein [Cruciviridae sp.]